MYSLRGTRIRERGRGESCFSFNIETLYSLNVHFIGTHSDGRQGLWESSLQFTDKLNHRDAYNQVKGDCGTQNSF